MSLRLFLTVFLAISGCWFITAASAGDHPLGTFGWRGNYTGLWPEADVPTEWTYQSQGVRAGLRCSSEALPADKMKDAAPVDDGFLRHWLVAGPFPVTDSVKEFDQEQLPKEAELSPAEGQSAGDATWKKFDALAPGNLTFGDTELQHVDLTKVIPFKINQIAYAHTYLYAAKAGKVRAVVEHGHGMKAYLNGVEIYKKTSRGEGIGTYVGISRSKLDYTWPNAPAFEMDLKEGMNRLTIKMSTAPRDGWREMRFSMWLTDPPETPYASKNIRWRAELPERSSSVPILVKDRLYLMAEPDELICLDAKTGKQLWSHMINYYEALTPEHKAAQPAFADKVDPLVAELKAARDDTTRLALRKKINDTLKEIDAKTFGYKMEGHLSGHFGIVGFTTPMPCSDGQSIYVFVGTGLAARFDLDGNRKWITRLPAKQLVYPAGGAVIAGKFVVFFEEMIAFDCETGKELWRQKEVTKTSGALLPARLAGVDVVISQLAEIIRASDGHVLWKNPEKRSGDTGWAPPTVSGETVYLPWCGMAAIFVIDCAECTGDDWKPKFSTIGGISINKKADGTWVDKWTAGSLLIHEGFAYGIDMYGTFYAVDLKEQKLAYRQQIETRGLQHYNALGIAASPTLFGKNVYVSDNQGTTFVIETGGTFKLVATNRIANQIQRTCAIPPQEIISYAAPISDGRNIFIRGEKFLYCIGKD
jgi:outer membrane protein assembly factor BamB